MAMGQNPVPPVNIPIPTKMGSKMGGEFTYPKMGSTTTVLTTTADWMRDPPAPRSWRALVASGGEAQCWSPRGPTTSTSKASKSTRSQSGLGSSQWEKSYVGDPDRNGEGSVVGDPTKWRAGVPAFLYRNKEHLEKDTHPWVTTWIWSPKMEFGVPSFPSSPPKGCLQRI